MTTLRQIKTFIKPILTRHDDLARIERGIAIKPVHHFMRVILIDRTSSAENFRLIWAVLPLCEPWSGYNLGWGSRVGHPHGGVWDWTRPGLGEAFTEAVETEILPLLRNVRTLAEMRTFASQDIFLGSPFPFYHLSRMAVEIALGELDAARETYDLLTTKPSRFYGTERYIEMTTRLGPLLAADDRAGMAALLHEWEERSVKVLKLDNVWERTPFPLEEMG